MPDYISDVLQYQDLEKINYSTELKDNASDYSQFVNDRVNQIVNDSFQYKRSSFEKAHTDLARYMDMEHNANNFRVRNRDVLQLQETIKSENEKLANSYTSDVTNSRRQFEINEYYYYNKLETLFFLQLFFIATLVMALVVYSTKMGIFGPALAGYFTLIVLAIVIGTGVYRYYYTKNTRDTRFWHRRRFDAPDSTPVAPARCDPDGNIVVDVNSIIPARVTRCASSIYKQAENKMDEVSGKLEESVSSYLQSGTLPSGSASSMQCN